MCSPYLAIRIDDDESGLATVIEYSSIVGPDGSFGLVLLATGGLK